MTLPPELEYNSYLTLLYAASIYVLMLTFSGVLLKFTNLKRSLTPNSDRYGSIDGLRGLLATGVLIHHSFAAYVYFTTGVWSWSNSSLLNHLGQTTVAIFFMITGFLFTNKASKPSLNWHKFYLSRLGRLAPLHSITVFIVIIIVSVKSNFTLMEPPLEIIKEIFLWITMSCFGRPDINSLPMTWTIIAGVNWSLKYEVIFYVFAVPAIHLISKIKYKATLPALAITLLVALISIRSIKNIAGGDTLYTCHFLIGIIVACAHREDKIKPLIEGKIIKLSAFISVILLVSNKTSHNTIAIISTGVIFASITGGLSIFGLLRTKPAIWLGDISYGIYLLHGIFLWILVPVSLEYITVSKLDLTHYWLIVVFIAFCVTMLSSLIYAKIEKPVIDLSNKNSHQYAALLHNPTCKTARVQ